MGLPFSTQYPANIIPTGGDKTNQVLVKYQNEFVANYTEHQNIAMWYEGATAPLNPVTGQRWKDTSVTPSVLRRYAGSMTGWVIDDLEIKILAPGNLSGAINQTSVSMASSATMNIGAAAGNSINATGTATVTAFDTIQSGTIRYLTAGAAMTLTHNATSLILFGSNITMAAGDTAILESLGSGNWRCISYQPANCYLSMLFNYTWTEKFLMINPSNGYISPMLEITRNSQGQNFYFYPQGSVSSATSIYFFTGNGTTTLSGALTNVATTMLLSGAITFAGSPYALIDVNGSPEIVQMTAGSGTTSITIVRGQLGTVALSHNSGGIILNSNPGSVSISSIAPASWNSNSLIPNKRDLFAYSISGTGFAACNITAVQEWGNR